MKKTRITIVLAVLAAAVTACSPIYVLRAGFEEARILSRRQPIQQVIDDPGTADDLRDKLQHVVQARTFAQDILDLDVGDSYTTYSWIDRDTLALVLSAAHPDRFEPVTWWFPIVGHIPYKGYFSLRSAERAAARLERDGYDTYIRPTSAFSTLGWFNDPLLSTLVRYGEVPLVSTVIHELTHNTIFIPSQVAFNESFANFVGDRGAIEYFCTLEGEDGQRCRQARDHWSDNIVFSRFLGAMIDDLEAVFAREELTREERLALRDEVYAEARARFVEEIQPQLSIPNYRNFANIEPNNARLIA